MKAAKWLQLIGLVIIARIFYKLDFKLFFDSFKNVDFGLLAVSIALLCIFVLTKALRWRQFLAIEGIAYPVSRALNAYLIGQFLSIITPAKLGDFVKVFYLERDLDIGHFRALSSVLADRLCDLAALSLLALLCMYLNFLPAIYRIPAQIFGWSMLVVVILLFHKPSASVIWALLAVLPLVGRAFKKIRPLVKEFQAGILRYRSWRLCLPLTSTAIAYYFLFLHAYYLARALRIDITLKETMFFTVIGNIAALLPISIGGLGPREQVMKELFTRILDRGQPATDQLLALLSAQAISFSLSFYGLFLLTAGIAGYIAWLRNPVSLDSVKRLAVDIRTGQIKTGKNQTGQICENEIEPPFGQKAI